MSPFQHFFNLAWRSRPVWLIVVFTVRSLWHQPLKYDNLFNSAVGNGKSVKRYGKKTPRVV